jgi:hypothetical protein
MTRRLRPLLRPLLLALAAMLSALTAGTASAQKRMLEKAEPPPPPPLQQEAPPVEPQVTIRQKDGDTIREYRLNGKLYMMQVIPARGPSYYLIDERGDGQFTRRDALDSGLRVPQWVIKSW